MKTKIEEIKWVCDYCKRDNFEIEYKCHYCGRFRKFGKTEEIKQDFINYGYLNTRGEFVSVQLVEDLAVQEERRLGFRNIPEHYHKNLSRQIRKQILSI